MYLIGEAKIRTHPSQILNQFGYRFKNITTAIQGVDVQNLVSIDSAVMVLRMREQNAFLCGLFVNISIPAFVVDTDHSFEQSFNA